MSGSVFISRIGGELIPAPARRPSVAVLMDHMDLFGGGCEVTMREALQATCHELGVDLLLIYGRELGHPDATHAAHNAVFELIRGARVDGVVSLSPALATHTGAEGLRGLFERSGVAARCSAGVLVEGMPSVVIDNLVGMRALLDHVFVHHGCRRVAFIAGTAGNPDAEVRFAAYRQALERAGLPFDPALVAQGDFVRHSGELGTAELLDAGLAFDALVAANDGMALGAIAALERRGRRVPEDVVVTGFDDLSMARLNDPPLTTVAQPLSEMMMRAVRSVVAQLRGEPVPAVVELPAQLVVRQSCGCGAGRYVARPPLHGSERAPPLFSREHKARLLERAQNHDPSRPHIARADAEALYDGLMQCLSAGTRLIDSVKTILRVIAGDNERRQALQVTLGLLRSELGPSLDRRLEDQFYEAHEQIGLTGTRVQVQQRLEIDQAYSVLMERGEQFSNLLDLPGLRRGLERHLPSLGMFTVCIAIHAPSAAGELLPVVCLIDGKPWQGEYSPFPAHELFLPGALSGGRRRTLLVFPLVLNTRCLGVAAFEYAPGTNGYVVVRDRVSVALGGVELHQTIVRNATAHERNLREQQRLANEERIRALNVLAGGVAHDLNNALGPLVALPDVLLEELAALEREAGRQVPALRSDLESIKSSALRASRTIKDLLAVSRQNRAPREPLELNELMRGLMADLEREALWPAEGLSVSIELCAEPLPLLGSETHLQRAVSNLVHNAVEAMGQRGQLAIRSGRRSVDANEAQSEGVPAGWYVTLSVSDTGRGIAASDLERVFEPFFSSKPLNDRSGSGLGLAIVDGVIKNHGGFVRVQSRLGAGTCFTLHLPLDARRPSLAVPPATALARGSGRILVVDDDPVQLRTARRLLEHFGYAVDAESSGAGARARFASDAAPPASAGAPSPYDLVILDVQLNEPEDGVQVYRRIRERHPRQRAIISSGHACPESAAADTLKELYWLPKPYTAQALADAVRSALSKREAVPPSSR